MPPSVLLAAKVKPGSKKPGLGAEGSVVMLRVRERALEGAANEACIRALSEALGVPMGRIRLVRGVHSREKRFAIEGLEEAEVRRRLGLDN